MAETHSLTTWPAKRWKLFPHDYILTVDGAFERANAPLQVWFIHFYETNNQTQIIQPFFIWHLLGTHLLSHGIYSICKVKCKIIFKGQ